MPLYQYQAYQKSGRAVRGTVEAESAESAQARLRGDGVYVSRLWQSSQKKRGASSRRHLLLFLKQLALFLDGGKTLEEALQELGRILPEGKIKQAAAEIRGRIRRGASLSSALRLLPNLFSPFVTAMVETGEQAGNLPSVLRDLVEEQTREEALRSQIRSALAYPAFVAFFCLAVVVFLFSFLVPRLEGLVAELGGTLPWITRGVIAFSEGLRWIGPWVGAAFLGGFIVGRRALARPRGKEWWDERLLRWPWVGELVRLRESARFCRAMATLIAGGMNLIRSLETASGIFKNSLFRSYIVKTREKVLRGDSLAGALGRAPLFPPLVLGFVRAGEESGDLKNQLAYVARMLEEEVQSRLKMFTTFLEPALIVCVGALVGTVLLAVILPIVQMTELVQ